MGTTASTEARTTTTATTTTAHSRDGASVNTTSSHDTPRVYPPPSHPATLKALDFEDYASVELPSQDQAVAVEKLQSHANTRPGSSVDKRPSATAQQRQACMPESSVASCITQEEEDDEDHDWHSQLQFVRPPKEIQTECPVCLTVFSEPYMVSCCGHSFCQSCIERIQTSKGSCPLCKERDFQYYHNKGLQRTLYDLQVCCPYVSSGCQWVGEMGNVRKHLSERDEFVLGACKFAKIECSQCHKKIQRERLVSHRSELCTQRPFKCDYCEYQSVYDDVVSNHWPTCKHYPVLCPNDCGASPQRQQLEHHVDEECPLTVVSCEFQYAGCDVQLGRKDMLEHMNENVVVHMSLLAGMTQTLIEESRQQERVTQQLNNKLEQGQKIFDEIKKENEELKSELQSAKQENLTLRTEIVSFTEKQEAAMPHQEIADLQKEVFTKLETEREAFIQTLEQTKLREKEERDVLAEQLKQEVAELKEGAASKTETELLKQGISDLRREQKEAASKETQQMRQEVNELRQKQTETLERAVELKQMAEEPVSVRETERLQQEVNDLRKKQKAADILKYEVSQLKQKQEESLIERETLRTHVGEFKQKQEEVEALKEEIVQLKTNQKEIETLRQDIGQLRMKQEQYRYSVHFTMSNFSKHRKDNDRWSSHPFYTYPHRYKLCLDVHANGFLECKGTHISIYARLLKGKFDDHLEWPFRGEIAIQLLNQLDEDKDPHEAVISFSDEVPPTVECATRVTEAEEPGYGWGYEDFIPQDALDYNQAEACQYLMDDCLSFRVLQAQPLDMKESLKEIEKEKEAACKLQPYSSLLVDCVDSKGKTLSWQDIGIMIDVPPGTTPEHNSVIVQVQCFLPGQGLSVILPESVQLASPVYQISATPQFLKDVELSIAHFATLDSDEDMTFLHSSDRSPPYHLHPVQGGRFVPHGTCGSLWLSKFCKYAIGRKRIKRTASERGGSTPQTTKRRRGSPCRYGIFFYSPLEQSQHDCRHAVFSASLYQPAFIKNLESELKRSFPNVKFWPSVQFVELARDRVELQIPSDAARQQGYSIISDRHCQISKGEIHLPDQFQQTFDGSFTMYPPRLQLTIEGYAGERPTIDLECSLDVKGTVEPCCFTLKMKAPPASEGVLNRIVRSIGRRFSSISSSSSASFEEPRDANTIPCSLRELSSRVAARVSHMWYLLGIQLGLDSCFLKAVEKDYRSSQDCCMEMFRQWLLHPMLNPSWETLIQALNSSNISQRDLAQELSRTVLP